MSLFSPEHGIRGILDAKVPSERDEKTGLTINSLYGETRRPTDAMLAGIDTLVIDLQDRRSFLYYQTAMAYDGGGRRETVGRRSRSPEPINGWQIKGRLRRRRPRLYFQMPVRHGMTMGELASCSTRGRRRSAVTCQNWRRDGHDDTGPAWINPSPNMRNLISNALSGHRRDQYSRQPVGRAPSSRSTIGAPWIGGPRLPAAPGAEPRHSLHPTVHAAGST